MLIMKLHQTEKKFYPKVKSQFGLSSLRVSCKHALKQLNKLKCTGGDRCTQPLKFKQKWQSYLCEQKQMHKTKNGDDNKQELLWN